MITTPDYVVVGHCALDRQADGSYLPGGTALYSALTAARFGMHVGVLTAGKPDALRAALAPYADAFALHIVPMDTTTIFENVPTPQGRVQTLLGWAGPILPDALPAAWRAPAVLHLGPIADELPPAAWADALEDVPWPVTTPQGWLRRWNALPSPVRHVPLALPAALLDQLRALVISNEELPVAEGAVRAVAAHGLGAITFGPGGADIARGDVTTRVPSFPVAPVDETGAGDVFAAAWFVHLARGDDAISAARIACAAAALSLTGRGPAAIPTRAAVDALMVAPSGVRQSNEQ